MGKSVRIFDTTLRYGEQSPGVSLTVDEKLQIARLLAKMRADVIEAGFPITSPGDFAAVSAIAAEIRGPIIAGLARANKGDIDRAWEAVKRAEKPRIHTFIATSPVHMKYKLGKTPEEVLKAAGEAVRYARSLCADVEFSAEDATRSDWDFLAAIFKAAAEAGATVINIPDTVGYTTPKEYYDLITFIRERVPGVAISVHCHNDLGLAVANSLAAIEAGAEQVECTINGIGERAGNTSMEEIVMALRTRKDHYGLETNIDTVQIYRASRLVSTLSGMPVQHNKAIVGANAFAHESGIHQDGVLKERTTYEIMKPEDVGVKGTSLVLGKHSGRHAFRDRLTEMGYNLSAEDLEKAFRRFKELADKKKEISDRDLQALVEDEVYAVEETYSLRSFHVTSGNNLIPTATVQITRALAVNGGGTTSDANGNGAEDGLHEVISQEAACGDGPVDAVFKAIDRVTGFSLRLAEYSLKAVTSGQDALGEVSLRVEYGGRSFLGRGVSTDIIEASARAYLAAINKLVSAAGGVKGHGHDHHGENPGEEMRPAAGGAGGTR